MRIIVDERDAPIRCFFERGDELINIRGETGRGHYRMAIGILLFSVRLAFNRKRRSATSRKAWPIR